MDRNTTYGGRRISRRRLLKTGATAAGVLALGGTAVTPAAAASGAAAPVVGDHHFVSADGVEDERLESPDVEPAPVPDLDDPLVERRLGNPVDDGTEPAELDGDQLTWGEFGSVAGAVAMSCNEDDSSDVAIAAKGVVPDGLYTAWVIVFEEPGFDFESRDVFPFGAEGTAGENFVGGGPLGAQDGSENDFVVGGGSAALTATHPAGEELSVPGPDGAYTVEGCLLDEYEVHIVGDYHLDGETHGAVPGPPGNHVEQFGAVFVEGERL